MGETELRISALGVTVSVTVESSVSAADQERLLTVWKAAESDGIHAAASLHAGIGSGARVRGAGDPFEVWGADYQSLASNLSTRVTLAAIEHQKSNLTMLHACGVADQSGKVAAFVGPSGRGKTTLATQLGRAFGYVTDETVGITAEGRVLPYRKPLSVIPAGRPDAVKEQIGADELGLLPLPSVALEIARIVLIDRQSDRTGAPSIAHVGLIDALVQLVPELSYLPHLDRPLQTVASLINRVGGIRRITYCDAADVPAAVPGLFVTDDQNEQWRALPLSTPNGGTPQSTYSRMTALDAIGIDDRYVLLHGQSIRVIDGIGPAIWDALSSPCSVEEVAEFVVDRFGPPAGSDAITHIRTALKDLVDSGVIAPPISAEHEN